MKWGRFLLLTILQFTIYFCLFSQQSVQTVSPSHRDFIKVSTDTLFACIDIFNYFTDRKFDAYFSKLKKLWIEKKFEEFDKLCDSLGSNSKFFAVLKEKKQEGKTHFVVRMPFDSKRISFNPESKSKRGGTPPPESEEVIVSCDCPSPCNVCFCPGSCNVPYYICLCFYDSSPGGIPGGGGGGGFFCNFFHGGKPCAVRPPDYQPKK